MLPSALDHQVYLHSFTSTGDTGSDWFLQLFPLPAAPTPVTHCSPPGHRSHPGPGPLWWSLTRGWWDKAVLRICYNWVDTTLSLRLTAAADQTALNKWMWWHTALTHCSQVVNTRNYRQQGYYRHNFKLQRLCSTKETAELSVSHDYAHEWVMAGTDQVCTWEREGLHLVPWQLLHSARWLSQCTVLSTRDSFQPFLTSSPVTLIFSIMKYS